MRTTALLVILSAAWLAAAPVLALADPLARNALDGAASPYLRLHKDDPVHWQEWTADTLELARRTGRPIFLSIGYSACHWCHVMQEESFSDPETAALMNRLFINVLVDREARPDVDETYRSAVAQMEGISGWPLNVFLTPDGAPYLGGVYFPPRREFGVPAFREVLVAAADAWAKDRERVVRFAGMLLGHLSIRPAPAEITPARLDAAARGLLGRMDPLSGGFGTAPKYPSIPQLEAVWRYGLRSDDEAALNAVSYSVNRMLQGGLYDHLGGGFARYAVDPDWRVPHFEKMLYVNAQLVRLMTLVWQRTRDPLIQARVEQTVTFLRRDLMLPGGAFAASLDSDSDGREGAYYVWDEDDVDRLLGDDAALFKLAYGVESEGNWEGTNVLYRVVLDASELAAATGRRTHEIEPALSAARARLLAARQGRARPFRDEKVIAGWNGLAIAALALAGRAFDKPEWVLAAERAFSFVESHLAGDDETVARYWVAGRGMGTAAVTDLAAMADAALTLSEATGEAGYRMQAERLVRQALARYWDDSIGGFYLAAAGEGLPVRQTALVDGEIPAGNAGMAEVMARLYYLTGDAALSDLAAAALSAAGGPLRVDPFPFASHLNAAETLLRGVQVVVIGTRGEPEADALVRTVWRASLPSRVFSVVRPGTILPQGHPARFKGQLDGRATAYVCVGQICSYPLVTPEALREHLAGGVTGWPGTGPPRAKSMD